MPLSTTYGGDGTSTITEAGAYPGAEPDEAFNLFREAARRRYQQHQQAPQRPPGPTNTFGGPGGGPGLGASYGGVPRAPRQEQNPENSESPGDRIFRAQQRAAEVAKLQALTNPPPLRMVLGPGVIPGYTMDVNRMNAFQRQAFLPNSSQDVTDPAAEARRRALEDINFRNFGLSTNAAPRGRT